MVRAAPRLPPAARSTATAGARVVVLAALAVLGACSGDGAGDPSDAGAGVTVIATTGIWADVAANVACGGLADVRSLMAPGTDPHAFEPSLADRTELGAADVVVANGLGLEGSLSVTLDDVEDEGVAVVPMGDHVRTIAAEGSHDDDGGPGGEAGGRAGDEPGHDEDAAGEGADPHVWQDPTRVAEALPALVDALVGAGLDRDAVQACADDYASRLAAADARITEVLAVVPAGRRKLVTSHDAFAYFADRYGLDVVGTVIPSSSTLAETNPGAIEDLSRAIEAEGVPAVFAEAGSSSDDVDALADRVGAAVVVLNADALGQEGSGPTTYLELLESNAQAIADALG